MTGDVKLGVTGLGYWGPNILRAASDLEGVEVRTICERDASLLARHARRFPQPRATQRFDDLLEDDELDGVVLATPISTHHGLARRALLAGKHVLVEKPLAQTTAECRELIELATERSLILMPAHTFLYSPPVLAVGELLRSGQVGDIFFGTSARVNLGIHQSDVSVVRDLAPHDFSIMLFWLGEPSRVRAVGRDAIVAGTLDVAFIDLLYPSGCLIHVEISWLAPTKLRRTVLVGTEKMIVYEDTSPEQVRIFDRGVEVMEPQTFGEFQLSYRSGDVLTPRLGAEEPLQLEIEDFRHAIQTGCQPRSHMELGLQVVRLIEATEASLLHNGAIVPLGLQREDRRRQPDRRRSRGTAPRARQAAR